MVGRINKKKIYKIKNILFDEFDIKKILIY